jgi:transposase
MTERTFRRWYVRFEEEGIAGLKDRRIGKPSAKRVPEEWSDRLSQLYRDRYYDLNVKHFHEHLVQDHGFPYSYTWAKSFLHRREIVALTPRKGKHRKKRPRRPLVGMMLHQDGSRHRWVPGLAAELDLIVTMDDASSEIYSGFLVEEEGTMSSFEALREVIGKKGLPCALGVSGFLCKRHRGIVFRRQRADAEKRSPNRMANCPMAAVHSTGLRQWTPAFRNARNSSFNAASSDGKLPRVLMILRNERCRLSTAFVV